MYTDSSPDSSDLRLAIESVRAVRERRRAELALAEERARVLAAAVEHLDAAEVDLEAAIRNLSDHLAEAEPLPASAQDQSAVDSAAAPDASGTLTERTSSMFANAPLRAYRAEEIATALNAKLDTVRTIIGRLVRRGLVKKLDRGVFQWGGNVSTDADA